MAESSAGTDGGQPRDDLGLYLSEFYGTGEGWLCGAVGDGPYRDEAGKYRHRDHQEFAYRWTGVIDDVRRELLTAARVADVWLAPNLMPTTKREKGDPVSRTEVHSEVDAEVDADEVRQIGAIAIASGTPGHAHVYVLLAESVRPHQHEQLCRGLSRHFGAKDSKVSDNDLLRPPLTFNHKSAVDGGAPTQVRWLVRPDGIRVDPQSLAQMIGVELTDGPTARAYDRKCGLPGDWAVGAVEVVAWKTRYPRVSAALKNNSGDRSADTARIVKCCRANGLTLNQTRWVIGQRADLAERLDGRHDDDIAVCWEKCDGVENEEDDENVTDDSADTGGCAAYADPASSEMPDAEFWDATKTLTTVQTAAWSLRAAPWAVLGVGMARVLQIVPPTVQLPPWAGGNASLNLFVGLVADSGKFKGTAERAAKQVFDVGPVYTTGAGSGEGINHLFAHYDKPSSSTVLHRTAVLMSVPEVDKLKALKDRNASTLVSALRSVWSGEELTFAYVDKLKAVDLPEHTYRLCLVVGVQPHRAGTLLDDADGGTPQRFLWLPCQDPNMPRVRPDCPHPIDLRELSQNWPKPRTDMAAVLRGDLTGVRLVVLPDEVYALVDGDIVDKHHDVGNALLDGHLGLSWMKTATALGLLHGEREVSSDMWALSEVVMRKSLETRAGVEKVRRDRAGQENRARGRAEGVRAEAAEETRAGEKARRISRNIVKILREAGGEALRSTVRDRIAYRDRDYFDDGLAAADRAGLVALVVSDRGEMLTLAEGGQS